MGRLICSNFDDIDRDYDDRGDHVGYCPHCGNIVYENVTTPERRTDWGYQQEEKEIVCSRCEFKWNSDELIHNEDEALDIEEKYFAEKDKNK